MTQKKTFLDQNGPYLTCMVQAQAPARIKELISLSIPAGAEAFGMQFCKMKEEYKSKEAFRELFDLASPFPTYVTNYRYAENEGKSDDALASELITLAECGATLCDVMGDYFSKCDGELTDDISAVNKQKDLINELHARGCEVLMSSHIGRFLPPEKALEAALKHKERGADISKIVVSADTVEQQLECMRTIDLLKRELGIPFLLLASGNCRFIRRIGESLGNCMSLCVYEYDSLATPIQPLLHDMVKIRKLF